MENSISPKPADKMQNAEPAAKTESSMKKNKFSLRLFLKLIAISILLISASQLYLFDSKNNGFGEKNFISRMNPFAKNESKSQLSADEVASIVKSLAPIGTQILIKDVTMESGLYKMSIAVTGQNGSQNFTGFLTLDGKQFFPQVINVADAQKQVKETDSKNVAPQNQDISKSDKPQVELFVMSHCPYGTQIEKGILPVSDLLKDKIDFSVKFVDYAMHGEKEIKEEMSQYCIQKEQPDKYKDYLKCFLEEGNSDNCLKGAKISASKLSSCVSSTDKEYKITENFNNKSSWVGGNFPPFGVHKAENEKYGVQGSPTLVINGVVSRSGRDSKSLLSAVCSAFTNKPSECNQELSSLTPPAGFGYDAHTKENSAASCGN